MPSSTYYAVLLALVLVLVLGVGCGKGEGPKPTTESKEEKSASKTLADEKRAIEQYEIGGKYFYGEGMDKDLRKAAQCYRKAAELGYAKAQNQLGTMYAKGQGVAESDAEAVAWYLKAAEQGHTYAQYNLGWMYAREKGMATDLVVAYAWWNIAEIDREKYGDLHTFLPASQSAEDKKKIAENMTPEQIAKAQKLSTELLEKIGAH